MRSASRITRLSKRRCPETRFSVHSSISSYVDVRMASAWAERRKHLSNRVHRRDVMDYSVKARRIDAHGSIATTKLAEVVLDTDVRGRADAFNPAELFLASVAACMIKGIERVTPILKFDLRAVEVRLHAVRQDAPPKIASVDYEVLIDTDESEHRLELLHSNVRKYGTISNTVAVATKLSGSLRRMSEPSSVEAEEHQAEIERVAARSREQLDSISAPGTDVLHEGP